MPDKFVAALRDSRDGEKIAGELADYLGPYVDAKHKHHVQRVIPTADTVLGVRVPILRTTARRICAELPGADQQLARAVAALWRGPTLEHRLVAALCCDALGQRDLKRLLRFLQQAEKRLRDWASCDALAQGCRRHARRHPALFLREARNRTTSSRPFVRRLGVVLLHSLATDGAFDDLPALFAVLRPLMIDPEPVVQKACAWIVRDIHRRDPVAMEAFLHEFSRVDAARGTVAAARRKIRKPARRVA